MDIAMIEKLLKTLEEVANMKADLFWCLGKLRGLGHPETKLEEAWGLKGKPPKKEKQ